MEQTFLLVMFNDGTPPAKALASADASKDIYTALPQDVRQSIDTAVTKRDSCTIAGGERVGARLRLALNCVLDDPTAASLIDDVERINGVKFAEREHIAHTQ